MSVVVKDKATSNTECQNEKKPHHFMVQKPRCDLFIAFSAGRVVFQDMEY